MLGIHSAGSGQRPDQEQSGFISPEEGEGFAQDLTD